MPRELTPRSFGLAVRGLTAADNHLGRLLELYGLPEFWSRRPGFPTLVWFILEQQVSLASARAALDRLLAALPNGLTPGALLALGEDRLRSAGITRQKTRYLRLLSMAVEESRLDLERLTTLPDSEGRRRLEEVPGIGRWTSDLYLLAALRRPDVWPVGDRALAVATGAALGLGKVPTTEELEEIGLRWTPHRSSAARLLWHSYLMRRGLTEPPDPF